MEQRDNSPSLIVDLVGESRGVDNVQAQLDSVLNNDYSDKDASQPIKKQEDNPVSFHVRTSHAVGQQRKRTMRCSLDFGGLPHGLIRGEATLGVDEVRGENRVDEGRLSETSLTCRIGPAKEIRQLLLEVHLTRKRAPKTRGGNGETLRRVITVTRPCPTFPSKPRHQRPLLQG